MNWWPRKPGSNVAISKSSCKGIVLGIASIVACCLSLSRCLTSRDIQCLNRQGSLGSGVSTVAFTSSSGTFLPSGLQCLFNGPRWSTTSGSGVSAHPLDSTMSWSSPLIAVGHWDSYSRQGVFWKTGLSQFANTRCHYVVSYQTCAHAHITLCDANLHVLPIRHARLFQH